MVLRHSAVGLQALLLTSMWKMNLVSLWWTTKLLLLAGVADSLVDGLLDVVVCPLFPVVAPGVLVVVSMPGVVHNAGVGKDGEIGKRFTQRPIYF